MTIPSDLESISNTKAAIKQAIINKGVSVSSSDDFATYPSKIASIETDPTLATLTVTPSTTAQTLVVPEGTDGYNTVSVSAVTASIDSDIVASNIKSGVNILGVSGSVTALAGQTKTVTITTTGTTTITPASGYNGLTSVKVSPKNQNRTVTPSTTQQTLSVASGYSGNGTVTVNAVTSSIDSNIQAGNIKSGVSILGVSGTVTALAGETRTVSITSTSGNTFTPSSGKNGITSIKVNPTNQNRTVTPSTTSQTLSVNSGYSGNGTITVNAVTSAIDSDIVASNIKSGVNILGVDGTVTELQGETRTVTPTTSEQTITPSNGKNGITSVTVNPVTSDIDSNIIAENIKSGVNILGVTGTLVTGILEGLLEDMINGNNPVDTTELQSVETQIHAFLGGS